jgi:hypothetical protein
VPIELHEHVGLYVTFLILSAPLYRRHSQTNSPHHSETTDYTDRSPDGGLEKFVLLNTQFNVDLATIDTILQSIKKLLVCFAIRSSAKAQPR